MSEYRPYMNMAPVSPAAAAVKKTGSSVVFLITAILYTLMTLLAYVDLFVPAAIPDAYFLHNVYGDLTTFAADPINNLYTGISVFTMAPALLGIIGLWLIFIACKAQNPRISTGGFSIFFGVLIARLAYMCLLLGYTVINTVFTFHNISQYTGEIGTEYITTIMTIGSAFRIVFCLIAIFYYAKAVICAHSVKKTARGIVSGKPISMFVIVTGFTYVGFRLFMLLLSLVSSYSVLFLLSSLCRIAFYVLIGVVLIQLRGRLKRIAAEKASAMGYTGGFSSWPNGPQ